MGFELKKEYREAIASDIELQAKIAKAVNKKNTVTVVRWVNSNSEKLTMLSVVKAVREYLGLGEKASLIVETK